MLCFLNRQFCGFKLSPKKALIIGAIILIVIVIVAVYFALFAEKQEIKQEVAPEEVTPEEAILELIKPGDVGEIEQGVTLAEVNPEALINPVREPDAPIPPIISDTKGEIISIQNDGITVMGSGENFADQKARSLFVKFTETTITFERGQRIKYTGLAGLRHLRPGELILISSGENIRGKTEFSADYINKL